MTKMGVFMEEKKADKKSGEGKGAEGQKKKNVCEFC